MRALPVRERRRRRAERARPVDRRAAADAAALQDGDRLVLRLARAPIPGTARDTPRTRACGSRVDELSGPSSISTTRRPASARISAAVPPPAPVPTIATSASSVQVARRAATRRSTLPARARGRRGSDRRMRRSCVRGARHAERRRAGIADRRPRARIAVPRREHELVQRVVRGAQQRHAAVAQRSRKRRTSSRRCSRPRRRGARQRRSAPARAPAARTAGRARACARGGKAGDGARRSPSTVSRSASRALRARRRAARRRASPARARA